MTSMAQATAHLAWVVQKMDSAIHRMNHYPVDKYQENQLRYPQDSDLSAGPGCSNVVYRYPPDKSLSSG